MRKLLPSLAICLTLILLLSNNTIFGQLVNNGATITIQTNAKIVCTGDVQNISGTMTNNGQLEVQGSFTNTGTYNTTTSDDSLIMTGTGNVTINPGGAPLSFLWINKTGASDEVKLAATTIVSNKFIYDQGNFTTDPVNNPSFVLSAPTAAVFSFGAGKAITGKVKRTTWANGTTVMFNEPNMLVKTNSGTAPSDFTVTMIPNGDPTQVEREVKRKFQFATTGGASFTTDITYPYLDAELNTNTKANLVPWQLLSSEWNSRTTSITKDPGNNLVSTTGLTTTELANEWKLADPKYTFNVTAFMRGPWINGTGLMRTTLNANGKLPLSQPYNVAPFNYAGSESVGSIPNANVVDWVLVEFRKPASGQPVDAVPATFIGNKAAFILDNGSIVDLDGVTPLSLDINKQGAGFFVIKHRTHLAIMSISLPSNVSGSYANDFSVFGNTYKSTSVSSQAVTALASTAPGNAKYGMWGGNTNSNGSVTPADVSLINATIAGPTAGKVNVYTTRDGNFDSNVTPADASIGNFSVGALATASTSAIGGSSNVVVQKSSVPGEKE